MNSIFSGWVIYGYLKFLVQTLIVHETLPYVRYTLFIPDFFKISYVLLLGVCGFAVLVWVLQRHFCIVFIFFLKFSFSCFSVDIVLYNLFRALDTLLLTLTSTGIMKRKLYCQTQFVGGASDSVIITLLASTCNVFYCIWIFIHISQIGIIVHICLVRSVKCMCCSTFLSRLFSFSSSASISIGWKYPLIRSLSIFNHRFPSCSFFLALYYFMRWDFDLAILKYIIKNWSAFLLVQ